MSYTGRTLSLYAVNGQRKYLNAAERCRFLAAAASALSNDRTLCC